MSIGTQCEKSQWCHLLLTGRSQWWCRLLEFFRTNELVHARVVCIQDTQQKSRLSTTCPLCARVVYDQTHAVEEPSKATVTHCMQEWIVSIANQCKKPSKSRAGVACPHAPRTAYAQGHPATWKSGLCPTRAHTRPSPIALPPTTHVWESLLHAIVAYIQVNAPNSITFDNF
jgi:hypothetical protein